MLSGDPLLSISSTTPSNMEPLTTPTLEHPRLTSTQHGSDPGPARRTPSCPTSHYPSSTNIADAKENLEAILATRVSFNDPSIVGVLIKPDEVSDDFVKNVNDHISKDEVITDSLTAVHSKAVELESKMYKPLVSRGCYPYFRC